MIKETAPVRISMLYNPEKTGIEVIVADDGRYLLQSIVDLNEVTGCASLHNSVRIITRDQIVVEADVIKTTTI